MGELKSGGHRRASILADAMEAIIGAIYLDSDFHTCQQLVLHWYYDRLSESALADQGKDAKTQLQEYMQSKKKPLPKYDVKKITGDAHEQVFHVQCSVKGLNEVAIGVGNNRRRAEQAAAKSYLNRLSNLYS